MTTYHQIAETVLMDEFKALFQSYIKASFADVRNQNTKLFHDNGSEAGKIMHNVLTVFSKRLESTLLEALIAPSMLNAYCNAIIMLEGIDEKDPDGLGNLLGNDEFGDNRITSTRTIAYIMQTLSLLLMQFSAEGIAISTVLDSHTRDRMVFRERGHSAGEMFNGDYKRNADKLFDETVDSNMQHVKARIRLLGQQNHAICREMTEIGVLIGAELEKRMCSSAKPATN